MLPRQLLSAVTTALSQQGVPKPIQQIHPVSGGDIGHSFRLETGFDRYFFKYRQDVPTNFFTAERTGLELLARGSTAVRSPRVIAHEGPEQQPGTGWILMEWVDSNPSPPTVVAEILGQGLAEIHRQTAPAFGLEKDNFIGLFPQVNGWMDRWTDFYRERRLTPQLELARKRKHLPLRRERLLTYLIDHLDKWLQDPSIRPSLLHGDLWGGNWMAGPDGVPYLIDPAAYYGHREVDLAFSQLFGGFPTRFYEAYQETWPLDPGYEERKPLYQLYYLLVHLNLFGESYGPSVDRILEQYAKE
ncbi:MAG: fructosamine kinase family protein [Firmicutes bacterium]|nr:fructosamine kinase family protein [Bacillota bacterium]